MLILLHLQVASRDCNHCLIWQYDEETGEVTKRGGQPIKRPENSSPPCRLRGIGCPKGTPENQKSLSPKNQRAYQHYIECKAVGRFPDDPLVREHAGIIRLVEESVEKQYQEISTIYLKAMSRLPSLGVR